MKQFVFNGPLTNLGRFGYVNQRDTLNLTDKEAVAINGDRRFTPLKDEPPKPGHFLEEKDKVTPEELRDIRNHNRSEQARLDKLAQVNSSDTVTVLELNECSYTELCIRADRMKVEYGPKTSKTELVRTLAAHMLKKGK